MRELALRVISRLKTHKLTGEVFISQTKGVNIEVSDGQCEKFNLFNDMEVGIRILKDNKWGLAYSTRLDSNIDDLIAGAVQNAAHNVADEFNVMPATQSKKPAVKDLNIYDGAITEMGVNEKLKLVIDLEKKALQAGKQISKVLVAGYTDSLYQQTIANTTGLEVNWQETFFSAMLELKAELDAKIQVGGDTQTKRFFRELKFDQLIDQAVFKTISMLGAKVIATKKIPVVFDPYVGCEFLALISAGISADNVQRKKSPFADKKESSITPEFVNIFDDGTIMRAVGSSPYDDEGIPTQRTVVIEKGVLKNFLYDSYTAAKDKTESTGNASRGSFMSAPGVGINNFYLEPGKISRQELLSKVKNGLYVMEVMGMHTADSITGYFSVGVSGLWIENGNLTWAVQGVAMAGNILELLSNIEMVSDDLRFYGNVGSPTIKIKEMMISGA